MKAADYRATMTEAHLQRTVTDMATRFGWMWYHTHDSRRSPGGFPDVTLVRAGRLVFAELKAEKGRLSAAQHVWARELNNVEENTDGVVQVFVWRPSDLPEIERILR